MSPEAAALFRQHDAGHVVFGCDTTVRGETLIDTWTIFGTTAGLRGYLAYLELPQVGELFARTGYGRVAVETLRWLADAMRVVLRSRRLSRKWPWREYGQYLDRRLWDIRAEFDIQVVERAWGDRRDAAGTAVPPPPALPSALHPHRRCPPRG